MLTLNKIFDNLFSDPKITPVRFRNFCRFSLNALTQANTDGKYDDAIAKVKAIIEALHSELSDVDSGLTEQVNSTSDVTLFIYNFGQYMKNCAGAIAYNLGGKDAAAYREFYPYKPEEYYRATKTTMPNLTTRLSKAAKKYANQLGDKLTTDLQAFAPAWDKLINSQEAQITAVNQDRKQRNAAFTDGQWTLTDVMHDVAKINSGNPAASEKLFPFAMLYPQKKSKIVTLTGTLAVSESKNVLNRFLTSDVILTVQNTVVNADVMVWLAASPKEDAPATAVVVNANTKSTLKAGDLGDLKNPYLMIKNRSDMNEAGFEIDISGLKREPKKEEKAAADNGEGMHLAS